MLRKNKHYLLRLIGITIISLFTTISYAQDVEIYYYGLWLPSPYHPISEDNLESRGQHKIFKANDKRIKRVLELIEDASPGYYAASVGRIIMKFPNDHTIYISEGGGIKSTRNGQEEFMKHFNGKQVGELMAIFEAIMEPHPIYSRKK